MIWKFLLAACECFRRYMNIIGEEYGRSSDEYLAAWEVWYGMKKGYDLAHKKYYRGGDKRDID